MENFINIINLLISDLVNTDYFAYIIGTLFVMSLILFTKNLICGRF